MKKLNLFTIILTLSAQIGFAKNKFNVFNEFPKRKIMLVLSEEDPTTIKEITKSGKPGDMEKYKSNIKKYNENLQFAFNEYWKDKPHDFISESKVPSIKNEELINLSVLSSKIKTLEGVVFYVYTLNTAYSETNKKGKIKYSADTRIFKVSLQNEIPSKAGFIFFDKQHENIF